MHVVDVQQGTIITPEMVDQLKPGMTRSQVRMVMGTPTINDPFNQDRWDYVYTYATRDGTEERRHIAVHFDGERVVNISDTEDPDRVW